MLIVSDCYKIIKTLEIKDVYFCLINFLRIIFESNCISLSNESTYRIKTIGSIRIDLWSTITRISSFSNPGYFQVDQLFSTSLSCNHIDDFLIDMPDAWLWAHTHTYVQLVFMCLCVHLDVCWYARVYVFNFDNVALAVIIVGSLLCVEFCINVKLTIKVFVIYSWQQNINKYWPQFKLRLSTNVGG